MAISDSPYKRLTGCVVQVTHDYCKTLPARQRGDLYRLVIKSSEKAMLTSVLESVDGNRSKAADILGITRATLLRKIRETLEG